MPTILDLPIGAKLKFGAYSVNGEKPHKICWLKAHRDCTILSEFIEEQCAFDAKEPNNPDTLRRDYGNNRYSLSNIHQFLNSEETNWFRQTHELDAAPTDDLTFERGNGYAHKPGFLHQFNEWEVDIIEQSEIKTTLPTEDIVNGEGHETIYAKIFLPSTTNIFSIFENGIQEGELWDLFLEGKAPCSLSDELYNLTTNKPDDKDTVWRYSLRTPMHDLQCGIRSVDRYGNCDCLCANDTYTGVRPALKLSPDTKVSHVPNEEGYYEVLEQKPFEIDESEFFAILNKI